MRIRNLEDAEQVHEQALTDSALGRTVNVDALLRSKAQVYWNIAKKVWSVRDKATGLVVLRLPCLRLENCKFNVQPGGRARVLREKQKNVHAFVEGELDCCGTADGAMGVFADIPEGERVTYNPYKHETFVLEKDGTPIYEADTVILTRIFVPGKGYRPCVEAVQGVVF